MQWVFRVADLPRTGGAHGIRYRQHSSMSSQNIRLETSFASFPRLNLIAVNEGAALIRECRQVGLVKSLHAALGFTHLISFLFTERLVKMVYLEFIYQENTSMIMLTHTFGHKSIDRADVSDTNHRYGCYLCSLVMSGFRQHPKVHDSIVLTDSLVRSNIIGGSKSYQSASAAFSSHQPRLQEQVLCENCSTKIHASEKTNFAAFSAF
jgi:hypothetical protein